MKRKEEKGSRDFPWLVGSVGKLLAAGVARVPSARALRWHVSSAHTHRPQNCALGAAGSLSSTSLPSHSLSLIPQGSGVKAGVTQNSPRFSTLLSLRVLLQPYERFPSTSDPQRVRSHVHLPLTLCRSLRVLLTLTQARPFFRAPPPPRARRIRLSANRGKDTPPSLVTVTGGFSHPAG